MISIGDKLKNDKGIVSIVVKVFKKENNINISAKDLKSKIQDLIYNNHDYGKLEYLILKTSLEGREGIIDYVVDRVIELFSNDQNKEYIVMTLTSLQNETEYLIRLVYSYFLSTSLEYQKLAEDLSVFKLEDDSILEDITTEE